MPTAYIFCPSQILNQKKINIPVSCDNGNIYIAADSGIHTAEKLNIKPDIMIGDFDSFDLTKSKYYFNNSDNIKIIKYPAEKDDTDLMLAVKYALGLGYKNIAIIGGLGGRIDHTLVNIFYLKYIYNNNGCGYITDGYNKISYFANSNIKIYKNYKYVSVIPLSPEIRGVTIKGFKYLLNDATVRFEEPYTVCNEILSGPDLLEYGEIIISDGEALICECDD